MVILIVGIIPKASILCNDTIYFSEKEFKNIVSEYDYINSNYGDGNADIVWFNFTPKGLYNMFINHLDLRTIEKRMTKEPLIYTKNDNEVSCMQFDGIDSTYDSYIRYINIFERTGYTLVSEYKNIQIYQTDEGLYEFVGNINNYIIICKAEGNSYEETLKIMKCFFPEIK